MKYARQPMKKYKFLQGNGEPDWDKPEYYHAVDVDAEIKKLNAEIAELKRVDSAHQQVAINIQETLDESTKQYNAEIKKLRELLIARDGGSHDVDCKSRYGKYCNCGVEDVRRYLNGVVK